MKFKEFIHEQYILAEQRSDITILLTEVESTVNKIRALRNTADMIQGLDIVDVFTEIRTFMKSSAKNMKISQLQLWGTSIIKELEINIKSLLSIKKTMQTSYLDSLITQSSKLVNNIKTHVKTKKEEYDLESL